MTKSHKGNMSLLIIFSLLSIAILTSALTWTSAMKYTVKTRATSSSNQYSLVTMTNVLSSAIISDIGNMSASKGNDFITESKMTEKEAMLEAMQDSQFSVSNGKLIHKVTEPLNIIKNTAMNIQHGLDPNEAENIEIASDVKEDMALFLKNAKMECTLETEVDGVKEPALFFDEENLNNTKDAIALKPFYMTVKVSRGNLSITQTYLISDVTVTFRTASDGYYSSVNITGATAKKLSQNIGAQEIVNSEIK